MLMQLQSDSVQYGFKHKSSCSHALLTLKTVTNHYVKDTTVSHLPFSADTDDIHHSRFPPLPTTISLCARTPRLRLRYGHRLFPVTYFIIDRKYG